MLIASVDDRQSIHGGWTDLSIYMEYSRDRPTSRATDVGKKMDQYDCHYLPHRESSHPLGWPHIQQRRKTNARLVSGKEGSKIIESNDSYQAPCPVGQTSADSFLRRDRRIHERHISAHPSLITASSKNIFLRKTRVIPRETLSNQSCISIAYLNPTAHPPPPPPPPGNHG